ARTESRRRRRRSVPGSAPAGARCARVHRREAGNRTWAAATATMRQDNGNPEPAMPPPPPVALVTGGARRLGAAIVRRLHASGYAVAVHCRHSADAAHALAADLEQARPGSSLVVEADLARFDALPELVARTVGRFGRLDALVNNAAAFFPTPFGTVTPDQWDALLATNLRRPFFLAQAAAPHLREARGAIVNISDVYARQPSGLLGERGRARGRDPGAGGGAGAGGAGERARARRDPVARGRAGPGAAGTDPGAHRARPHRHGGGDRRHRAVAAARCRLH